jgi:hypothetical protein
MSKTMRRPVPLAAGTPEELVSPGAEPCSSLDASHRPLVGLAEDDGPGVGVGAGVVAAF